VSALKVELLLCAALAFPSLSQASNPWEKSVTACAGCPPILGMNVNPTINTRAVNDMGIANANG
jgi:hypothetical protein